MDFYQKTIKFVDDSFQGKQKAHFERAVYWMLKFFPDSTEAHKIAAYSHDIERAFRDKNKLAQEDYLDSKFLRSHMEGGAVIMVDFLGKEKAPQGVIDTVMHLIGAHEIGGDTEQNALMDADSVSFFETNAEMFVTKKAPVEGYESIKRKLDWMFERISNDEHRSFARPNYEKWIRELEVYKE